MRTRRLEFFGFVAVLVVIAIALALWLAPQKSFTVCPSGCDFAVIQTAILAAPAGSTVPVRAGTYKESLTISKALSLAGEGPNKTIIEGAITISGAKAVSVMGFTVKSLHIENSQTISLANNEIIAGDGVGLSISKSTAVTVRENRIQRHHGSGIVIIGESQVVVSANTISANGGDGIFVGASQAKVQDNVIGNNAGCGIRADSASRLSGAGNKNGFSVPEDFRTIQEALNAWRPGMGPNQGGNSCNNVPPELIAGEGGVAIAAGIYREHLTIRDQALVLRGAGAAQTILDGSSLGDVDGIAIRGSAQVTIESLTIRNFKDDGIDAEGAIGLTVQSALLSGNDSTGIEIAHGLVRARILNSIIRDNRNYGLWVLSADTIVECQGTALSGNGADYGGPSQEVAAAVAQKCR